MDSSRQSGGSANGDKAGGFGTFVLGLVIGVVAGGFAGAVLPPMLVQSGPSVGSGVTAGSKSPQKARRDEEQLPVLDLDSARLEAARLAEEQQRLQEQIKALESKAPAVPAPAQTPAAPK